MKWTVVGVSLNNTTKVKAPFEIQQEGNISLCLWSELEDLVLITALLNLQYHSIHT